MPYNPTWPVGTQSVRDNRSTGADNTAYIKVTNNVDHVFDEDADLDGHHRWVSAPSSGPAAAPVDPTLTAQIDGITYFKFKTPTESAFVQHVLPYYRNASSIVEVLGIRACALANINPTTFAIDVRYSHNIAMVGPVPQFLRTGVGEYSVTFATALPSRNYLMYVDGVRGGAGMGIYGVQSGTPVESVKDSTGVLISVKTALNVVPLDPIQLWFVAFGG